MKSNPSRLGGGLSTKKPTWSNTSSRCSATSAFFCAMEPMDPQPTGMLAIGQAHFERGREEIAAWAISLATVEMGLSMGLVPAGCGSIVGAKKKPTWPNTLKRYSTTSAYSSTSPPNDWGCPLSSHPTTSNQLLTECEFTFATDSLVCNCMALAGERKRRSSVSSAGLVSCRLDCLKGTPVAN